MSTDQVHEVNSHSLLLRVEGSEASSRPYMLAAHLDVVPPGDTDRSHVRSNTSDQMKDTCDQIIDTCDT